MSYWFLEDHRMIRHPNLDPTTRVLMEHELDSDIARNRPPASRRLTSTGAEVFPLLIRDAVRFHDDSWLSNQVACCGRLRTHEPSRRHDQALLKRVPFNAAETLAEGHVRRYYLRAIARRATSEHRGLVIVRGKYVENPRPQSQRLIGTLVDPAELYAFATTELEDPTYNGPFAHNSGLTVTLE